MKSIVYTLLLSVAALGAVEPSPTLALSFQGGVVTVCWDAALAVGYCLEQSENLADWYPVPFEDGSFCAPSAPPPRVANVTLAWDPNPEEDEVLGYRLYWDAGSAEVSASETTTIAPDLAVGTTYTFTVTAFNERGESGPSEAVVYTVPPPVVAPIPECYVADSGATKLFFRLHGGE